MGLDYSYEIFLPPQNVGRALARLAEIARRDTDKPLLSLALPGGEKLDVPFTSRFKSDPVDVSTGGALALETVLMFDVDNAIRQFQQGYNRIKVDESGRLAIGIIYLAVHFAPAWHPGVASMQFTAATSGMSRMFQQSASVRTAFTDLTAASDGVCCVFDDETGVFDICWLNGEPLRETVPGPRFRRFHNLVAAW